MLRRTTIFSLMLALAACVGPPQGHRPPSRRPVDVQPPNESLRQCLGTLNQTPAQYSIFVGEDHGGGCSTFGTVHLTGVSVPVSNITAIQCPLARALTLWTQSTVQSAARLWFGSAVSRVESMGSYSCRRIAGGASNKLSEHATGNAVDISGFVLADGRRITVAKGWQGAEDEQGFLRAVHDGGCNHFRTVLGPDYNAAHFDHLHFDMGGRPFCR